MRILFCLMLSFLVLTNLKAQYALNIIYDYPENSSLFEKEGVNHNQIRLIINDSMTFWYVMVYGKDVAKKSRSKFSYQNLAHDTFYKKAENRSYSLINLKGEDIYLRENDTIEKHWVDAQSNKKILGLDCKSAFTVNSNNDTILVYYTESLSTKGAPLHEYNDIPGVVLEVFDQKIKKHLIAISIKPDLYDFRFPFDIQIVNTQQSLKRLNKYRENHHFHLLTSQA